MGVCSRTGAAPTTNQVGTRHARPQRRQGAPGREGRRSQNGTRFLCSTRAAIPTLRPSVCVWLALSLAQGQRQTGSPHQQQHSLSQRHDLDPASANQQSLPQCCYTITPWLSPFADACSTPLPAQNQHAPAAKSKPPRHAWLTTCVLTSCLAHPATKLHPPARAAAGQPNACSAQPKSTLPRSLQSQNAAATPYRPSSWQVLLAWNPCDSACQASAAASKKAACMAVSLLQTCCLRAACCCHEASTRLALHHCRWLWSTCCCAALRCRKSAAAAAITCAAACRRCRQLRMWSSSAASGVLVVLLLLLLCVSGCCRQSGMAPRACKAEMLSLLCRIDSMAGNDMLIYQFVCLLSLSARRHEMDDWKKNRSARQTVNRSDCSCFGVFGEADHFFLQLANGLDPSPQRVQFYNVTSCGHGFCSYFCFCCGLGSCCHPLAWPCHPCGAPTRTERPCCSCCCPLCRHPDTCRCCHDGHHTHHPCRALRPCRPLLLAAAAASCCLAPRCCAVADAEAPVADCPAAAAAAAGCCSCCGSCPCPCPRCGSCCGRGPAHTCNHSVCKQLEMARRCRPEHTQQHNMGWPSATPDQSPHLHATNTQLLRLRVPPPHLVFLLVLLLFVFVLFVLLLAAVLGICCCRLCTGQQRKQRPWRLPGICQAPAARAPAFCCCWPLLLLRLLAQRAWRRVLLALGWRCLIRDGIWVLTGQLQAAVHGHTACKFELTALQKTRIIY